MITQKFDSNVVVVLKTTTSFKFPSYVDHEKNCYTDVVTYLRTIFFSFSTNVRVYQNRSDKLYLIISYCIFQSIILFSGVYLLKNHI